MNQRPVGDRIIVKPDIPEDKTEGGIILAETSKEKCLTGTVLSIGDETENKFTVRPGMRVRFGMYSGTEIQEMNEDPLLIMREVDIYTIIG
jgi:chaperonin GroES